MKKNLAGLLLAGVLSFLWSAEAMPTEQFDKMSHSDRSTFITQLALGSAKALYDNNDIQGGDKLKQIFDDNSKNGGFEQLLTYIDKVRAVNNQNAQDPNKPKRYDVEAAMALLMKNNGIKPLPLNVLLAINKDFKPSAPASAGQTNSSAAQNLKTNSPAAK